MPTAHEPTEGPEDEGQPQNTPGGAILSPFIENPPDDEGDADYEGSDVAADGSYERED